MPRFYLEAVFDGVICGSAGVFGFCLVDKNWGAVLLSGIIAVFGIVVSLYIKCKK
jgi:hypothetical protein